MKPNLYIDRDSPHFWKATIALSAGGFLIFSNFHLTQPLLPLFSEDFSVSAAVASLTISLVTFTLSIFLLVFGPISDAVGRKNVMLFGLLATSLLSIFIYFVTDFSLLLLLRTLQGIALASLPAIAYAYIAEEFAPNTVSAVIGLYIGANTIGGMGGRIIGGFSADIWGWRSAFLIMGLLGLVCTLLFFLFLPKSKFFKPHPFTLKVAVKEMKVHWKNPILRDAYYLAALTFLVFMGMFNYLAYYLHGEPFYFSTTVIGLLYISYLAGTFSSIASGRMGERLSIFWRIFIGVVIMMLGIACMLVQWIVAILLGLLLICFGFFFAHSAASNWVSKYAQGAKASATSLYLLAYYFGGSVGSTLLGFIYTPWGWPAVCISSLLILSLGIMISLRMRSKEITEKDGVVTKTESSPTE